MRLPLPSGPPSPSHVALLAILSDADGREVIRSFSDAIAPTAPTAEGATRWHAYAQHGARPPLPTAEGADAGMPDATAAADEVIAYAPPTVAKGGTGLFPHSHQRPHSHHSGGLFPNWARAPSVWVGQEETTAARADVLTLELETALESPQLWSAESPYLYVGWPLRISDGL